MKLDPDCMRDVLLEMEDTPFMEELHIDNLHAALQSRYTFDVIDYTIFKLIEAGFITATTFKADGLKEICSVDDITFSGHQFLAEIRSDSVWNGVKEIGSKIGATSVNAFVDIASNIVTELIKAHFGLQ